jgi:hypothetical protein
VSSYDLDGSSTTKEGVEKVGIRQIVREEIAKYLQDPLGYEKEFKGWLPEWIGQAGIDIPIGQVIGYSQTIPQTAANIPTREDTSSATFADLATVGPTLTGLSDGTYVVYWGATCDNTPVNAYMGVKVNSTEPADDDSIFWSIAAAVATPGMRAIEKTLDGGGNNTLTARYRVSTGTGFYRNRWMLAVRVSN